MNMIDDSSKVAVRKSIEGRDALLIRDGADFSIIPEDLDFEPLLARDISENDEDFIIKGTVVDKMFIATDVVYHGEFLANKPWKDRFLDLKKNFDYSASIRWSGSIVVDKGNDVMEAAKAYSKSPYFDGVYLEKYDSDMFSERLYIPKAVISEDDE